MSERASIVYFLIDMFNKTGDKECALEGGGGGVRGNQLWFLNLGLCSSWTELFQNTALL